MELRGLGHWKKGFCKAADEPQARLKSHCPSSVQNKFPFSLQLCCADKFTAPLPGRVWLTSQDAAPENCIPCAIADILGKPVAPSPRSYLAAMTLPTARAEHVEVVIHQTQQYGAARNGTAHAEGSEPALGNSAP